MTAAVSNPEEEFLFNVVENVSVRSEEISSVYEETVISHSTAIQNEKDLVHRDFRRKQSGDVSSETPESRLYSEVLMVRESLGEPTHVTHTPSNRFTVQPSESDYTIHKLNSSNYQDTLILSRCLMDEGQESDSDEDLEDLPRFRSRLAPCGPQAEESARAIRSGTLSGDEIEIMRHNHEQDYGIPMLNELRDTIPRLDITEPGNSMFYETAFPLITPKSTADTEVSCYENTDYFTRSRLVIPVDEQSLTFSVEHYSTTAIEEESAEPIYSQPIKPKDKKISRSECEDILGKCYVGTYMLRRNKETTIMSVKVHTKVKHIKLEFDKDIIKVGKESFNSLPEMIKFYQNSVPVSLVNEPVFLTQEVDSQGLVK